MSSPRIQTILHCFAIAAFRCLCCFCQRSSTVFSELAMPCQSRLKFGRTICGSIRSHVILAKSVQLGPTIPLSWQALVSQSMCMVILTDLFTVCLDWWLWRCLCSAMATPLFTLNICSLQADVVQHGRRDMEFPGEQSSGTYHGIH